MEPSPLTQQVRPEVFQQKIVELYEVLLKDEEDLEKTEGFWLEFFLLKPNRPELQRILDSLKTDDLLHIPGQTRELFARAIAHIKSAKGPADSHALDTLTAFFTSALAKKYTNPSSDIISVLAGLGRIDAVFTDFVAGLDVTIRTGRTLDLRQKAIQTAIAVTSGAYQTSLLSYFTHRDLFPSLMKFIHDSDTTSRAFEPFVLLGLLANYNKFEFQNPYRLRLDDFVNEATIQKIIKSVGATCSQSRSKYVEVQDDIPEGWSISSTLSMIGLSAIAPSPKSATAAIDPDMAKEMFAKLPGPEAAVLLATYDFAHSNKLFCFNFVSIPPESKTAESPISSFLSYASYILQHAHISPRTGNYAHLNLLTIRLLTEDQILCKKICSSDTKMTVRLCRQRQPYLPLVRSERILACHIMDIMISGLNHNLRKRLDVDLYILCIGILLRLISHLSRSRTRLAYHWSELFRSILTTIRFCTTYIDDLKDLSGMGVLVDTLITTLALSLSSGETFLPTPTDYDDLFYKIIESSEILTKFQTAYSKLLTSTDKGSPINILLSVSTHYQALLDGDEIPGVTDTNSNENENAEKKESKNKAKSNRRLSSTVVKGVIKKGYETLSLPEAREGALDGWEKYREVDERVFLKKVGRYAVGDARRLVGGE